MKLKKGKRGEKTKQNTELGTPIYASEKKLLRIFGQSESATDANDKYRCTYYCKSCIDVDHEAEYEFSKPSKSTTDATSKQELFMESAKLYFDKHPDSCNTKKLIDEFIEYRVTGSETLSYDVCSFSFTLLKQLDVYNFIVKRFQKHLCLNLFELEKKTKVEVFCADCKYKTFIQMPLNIKENSTVPIHDCTTGEKYKNKKRSFSAMEPSDNKLLDDNESVKKMKRSVSEQPKEAEKTTLEENLSLRLQTINERSGEHIPLNVNVSTSSNTNNQRGNQNISLNTDTSNSNKISKEQNSVSIVTDTSSLNKITREKTHSRATAKEKMQNKSKQLIAKGRKKIQRNNLKKQMSIVDILQKDKKKDNPQVSTLHNVAGVSTRNERSLRIKNSEDEKLILQQKHINPVNGDLLEEQISRLEPISKSDFKSYAHNDLSLISKPANPVLPIRSVSLSAPNSRPGSKKLNLFKRSVSSQPLFLDDSFLSGEEEEREGEKATQGGHSPTLKSNVKENINGLQEAAFNVELDLSDDSSEELPETKIKKRKPEYIPLSSGNLKHVHDVTEMSHESNTDRIISNISVDFAKVGASKNERPKNPRGIASSKANLTKEISNPKSRLPSVIETLKSPIRKRKPKSPIVINSNSPKRNLLIEENSDHDMRNISLNNTSIHSPKQNKYNEIKVEPWSLNKNRKLYEDEINLFKEDAYEGILNLSQINSGKVENFKTVNENSGIINELSISEKSFKEPGSFKEGLDLELASKSNSGSIFNMKPVEKQNDKPNTVETKRLENQVMHSEIFQKERKSSEAFNANDNKDSNNNLFESQSTNNAIDLEVLNENLDSPNNGSASRLSNEGEAAGDLQNITNSRTSIQSVVKNPMSVNPLINSIASIDRDYDPKSKEASLQHESDKENFKKQSSISKVVAQANDTPIKSNDILLEQKDPDQSEISKKIDQVEAVLKDDLKIKAHTPSESLSELHKEKESDGNLHLPAVQLQQQHETEEHDKETEENNKKTEENYESSNKFKLSKSSTLNVFGVGISKEGVHLHERATEGNVAKDSKSISPKKESASPTAKTIHKIPIGNAPFFNIRKKSLLLQHVSGMINLSMCSPSIISFLHKINDFESILELEKKQQVKLVTDEYASLKEKIHENHKNLCFKVDSCNNLNSLLELYQKLTSK